ncbi:hypothetical protein PHYSODRAFT_306539 [Phytophthora sojae]|uniref:Uncharacterized protein n=1 Tax=Phytophthora sojae (strain P6497) TaxID=1094619 RepID=G5A9R0_PHYSP|nr:hypothetical protein PHYSODRAFT_306539 [Phytophthora sojae]EGZ07340.1 hypothetical protein PHYSODRAFT_306539 [Phytophthora sojae]|eukprot:XP_009536906.1 hypothetical protein PHYSODRAFT_306539 [Phytophthora sojae]
MLSFSLAILCQAFCKHFGKRYRYFESLFPNRLASGRTISFTLVIDYGAIPTANGTVALACSWMFCGTRHQVHLTRQETRMRIGIVTLAAGVVLLSTSLSADAAIETKTTAVEPVTNPSLRSGTRWTEKSKVNDADGLDFSNVEDTDSSDEELSPSAKVVENEERTLVKPSASMDSFWVKAFYKMFPHVKPPAADIRHVPLRPPRFVDAGDGLVKIAH